MADESNALWATGQTGGTSTDLDGIDGNEINAGDIAFVVNETDGLIPYIVKNSGAAASPPDVIIPVSNAGVKRWHAISLETLTYLETKIDGVTILVNPSTGHIYIPTATTGGTRGVSSFDPAHFTISSGVVSAIQSTIGTGNFSTVDFTIDGGNIYIKQPAQVSLTQVDSIYAVNANQLRGNISFVNPSATGACYMQLPSIVNGMQGEVYVAANQIFGFIADASDRFRNGTDQGSLGGQVTANEEGAWLKIKAINGEWQIDYKAGIWTCT